VNPFNFYTKLDLIYLTNRRARNIIELLEGIREAQGSVIYYHTHRFLQQHVYLSPEPPNDFAYWTANTLQETLLAEKLAAIDIIEFKTIMELKNKLVKTIEEYILIEPEIRNAPPGMEFHFMKSRSFVLQTGYVANDLKEFYKILEIIDINSLYFHVFEARMRLGKMDNDFSIWLRSVGEEEAAEVVSRLDPYTFTLEGVRARILNILKRRLDEKD